MKQKKPNQTLLQEPDQDIMCSKNHPTSSLACDMESRFDYGLTRKGSETRCSFNDSLPVWAWLVTTGFKAIGTMEPFERERSAVKQS